MTEYELLEKGIYIPTQYDDSIIVNLRVGNKILLNTDDYPIIIGLSNKQINCRWLNGQSIFLFPKPHLCVFYWHEKYGLQADDIDVVPCFITLDDIRINNGNLWLHIYD